MRLSFLVLTIFFVLSVSEAAIFRVATGGAQPYSQVQPAINAASAGDTILVFPGIYNGFIVNCRLVVIGAGTSDLGEGTKITGLVEVNDAADSTELRSLWIRTNTYTGIDSTSSSLLIHSGATEILVWRCFIENYSGAGSAGRCAFAGNGTSTQWVQSVFWASVGPCNGLPIKNGSAVSLTACVFSATTYGVECPAGTSFTARHCVFTYSGSAIQPFVTTAYGTVENCVFLSSSGPSYSTGPNVGYFYCAGGPAVPPGSTNFVTTSVAFQNIVYGSPRASNYYLSATSNLRDAGRPDSLGGPPDLDSTRADLGIYGGLHPYVDGGIPDYPFMIRLDAPITVPQNGVMRIWARGQVGPGY